MIGWRIKANLVAFVVGSILLILGMATQVLSLLEDRYSVYAIFPDAGGVFTNQEVTYRGVQVGNVGSMEVVPEGVRIELRIDESSKIPAEDVQARVMFKSAVGEQFVDLLPQSDGEPYLADGDVIPKSRTDIPVSTQELLSTLEAVLAGVPPEALEGAVDSLGEGLTGRGRDLGTILDSTAEISEMFAARAPEVEGILENGVRVGDEFIASRADFERALEEFVTVSATLGDSTDELRRLLIGANLTSDEAVALIRENRPEIHALLRNLAEVNELQAQHAGDLNRLFLHLPTGLGKVVESFEPKTGLIRFSAVDEPLSAACSYGTERRPPENRSPRMPPRDARCAKVPVAENQSRSTATSAEDEQLPSADGLLDALSEGPSLPPRMKDWSWTLFYLRGLDPSA